MAEGKRAGGKRTPKRGRAEAPLASVASPGSPRPAEAVSRPASPPVRGLRAWVFGVVLAVAAPLLFLLLLEGGLRLSRYGRPTAFFLPARTADGDVLTDNPLYTLRFFPPALVRPPDPVSVTRSKPSGTVRIFVVGDSAAKGDPEPAYGFSRILEALLEERYPSARFEVINTAITAVNSHVELPIARECARLQPDLLVAYLGNNEVIGPYGPGTIFARHTPSLRRIRATVALKGTRTGQLLEALGRRARGDRETPRGWGGMEMFLKNRVARQDPRLPSVYRHLRANLESICRAGTSSGAGVVLCTVPVNLKDCPPFASMHGPGLSGSKLAAWNRLFEQGTRLQRQGKAGEALALYRRAARVDAEWADLWYRQGQCLETLGRLSEAKAAYRQALERDTLRFRADAGVNRQIREAARVLADQGVELAETAEALEAASPGGIPGEELLWEHVHLNFRGNYLFARTVLAKVEEFLKRRGRLSEKGGRLLTEAECRERLAFTPWDEHKVLTDILDRLRRPPFTNQWGNARAVRALENELARRSRARSPESREAAVAAYRTALARRPRDPVLQERLANLLLRDPASRPEAERLLRGLLGRLPHHVTARNSLGLALARQGRHDQAAAEYRTILAQLPYHVEARNNLGVALAALGRAEEAMEAFRQVLRIDPQSPGTHVNLGDLHREGGRTAEAMASYRRALRLDPNIPEAHRSLAMLLVREGRMEEGLEHFARAVALDPSSAETRHNLGLALLRCRRPEEAEAQFRAALRLRPDQAESRHYLATLLAREGRLPEAVAEWRKAVASSPRLAPAHADLGAALAQMGRAEEALEHLQRALELNPGHAAARSNLARLRAEMGDAGTAGTAPGGAPPATAGGRSVP